jgi:putative ABC transport system permease protein
MGNLLQNVCFGLRMLAKSPGFTAVAVLSLAVGIGVNSAVFSALNAALLRPLGFKDPKTVVRLEGPGLCYPDYRELSRQCRSIPQLVAVSRHGANLRGSDDVKMVVTEFVSPNYFSVLGIHAAAGAVFAEGDPRLRDEELVVISHRLWQRRFGGDMAIAGRTILLDDGMHTVLGVAQRDYHGISSIGEADLWFVPAPFRMEDRVGSFQLLGRRAPAASLAESQAEVDTIVNRLGLKNPRTGRPTRVVIRAETQSERGMLVTLVMAIVGLVLLVACANVSSMLLARNEERRREMAMRLTLGASRWRLIRQLLAESLLLSALGAIPGLLLTVWANGALLALVPPNLLPFLPKPHIDHRVLAVTGLLALLATIVSGLAPAWRAGGTDLSAILKGEMALGSKGWSRLRGRNVLVVGQLIVSVVFLVTAAFLVRALVRCNAIDLGFEKKPVLQLILPGPGQRSQELLERICAIPGVNQATLAFRAPLALTGGGAVEKVFLPEGQSAGDTAGQAIGFNIVAPNYFQMMGIRLLRGRPFEEEDGRLASRVVIISEAMARRWWPQGDPIGRLIRVGRPSAEPVEIIGIVRDVVRNQIGETPEPFIYVPLGDSGAGEMTLLVETKGEASAVLALVRRELRSFDERLEPFMVDTQEQTIRVALLPQLAAAWIFGVLGLLAFAMSAAGLYGVVAYSVARRTHEIGVRVALGAQASDTMKMILRQGLVLALSGLAAGLPLAYAVGKLLQSAVYGIDPFDPGVFLAALVLVIGVVLSASFFPARRATRIDPMVALRYE